MNDTSINLVVGKRYRFAPAAEPDRMQQHHAPHIAPDDIVVVVRRGVGCALVRPLNGRNAGLVLASSLTPVATLRDGSTFKHKGRYFRLRIEHDSEMGAPWTEHDGHGVVSEATQRTKRPGERILVESRDGYRQYYDMQASMKIARRDGWDAEPFGTGTPGQRAARAVEADFQHLRAWCKEEWSWCGVIVALLDANDDVIDHASLWGIESGDHACHEEVAYELADELLG